MNVTELGSGRGAGLEMSHSLGEARTGSRPTVQVSGGIPGQVPGRPQAVGSRTWSCCGEFVRKWRGSGRDIAPHLRTNSPEMLSPARRARRLRAAMRNGIHEGEVPGASLRCSSGRGRGAGGRVLSSGLAEPAMEGNWRGDGPAVERRHLQRLG